MKLLRILGHSKDLTCQPRGLYELALSDLIKERGPPRLNVLLRRCRLKLPTVGKDLLRDMASEQQTKNLSISYDLFGDMQRLVARV